MLLRPTTAVLALAVILAGCAQENTTTWRDLARAREEGLHGTSISGGACDGAGQFIPNSLYGGPLTANRNADEAAEWSATESWAP